MVSGKKSYSSPAINNMMMHGAHFRNQRDQRKVVDNEPKRNC